MSEAERQIEAHRHTDAQTHTDTHRHRHTHTHTHTHTHQQVAVFEGRRTLEEMDAFVQRVVSPFAASTPPAQMPREEL